MYFSRVCPIFSCAYFIGMLAGILWVRWWWRAAAIKISSQTVTSTTTKPLTLIRKLFCNQCCDAVWNLPWPFAICTFNIFHSALPEVESCCYKDFILNSHHQHPSTSSFSWCHFVSYACRNYWEILKVWHFFVICKFYVISVSCTFLCSLQCNELILSAILTHIQMIRYIFQMK